MSDVRPDLWAVAREVCTPRQLVIIRMREQHWSQRSIALYLGIDRSTVRSHIDAADRKIAERLREVS